MGNELTNKKINNFLLRVISSLVLLPVVIWLTVSGGVLYFILLIIASYIACTEWSYICGKWSFGIDTMAFITFVCLSITAFYMDHLTLGVFFLAAGAYITYFAAKFRAKAEHNFAEVIPSYINRPLLLAIGEIYIGLAFSSLAYLSHILYYNIVVLWIFGLVVSSDVSAYIFGSLIKGAKLAPKISPGKTWSGFVCAIVATFLLSYICASVLGVNKVLEVSLFGAAVVVVAHIGDLLESALKRYVQVKDSGNLIPGHGGMLDRIDALMLVAIFTFIVSFIAFGGN